MTFKQIFQKACNDLKETKNSIQSEKEQREKFKKQLNELMKK